MSGLCCQLELVHCYKLLINLEMEQNMCITHWLINWNHIHPIYSMELNTGFFDNTCTQSLHHSGVETNIFVLNGLLEWMTAAAFVLMFYLLVPVNQSYTKMMPAQAAVYFIQNCDLDAVRNSLDIVLQHISGDLPGENNTQKEFHSVTILVTFYLYF